jgi:ATP/maltotriose-dependent transcriptional regulator MalT
VAVSRGDYARGRELAGRAVEVCDEFRLGRMKKAFCLCHRASAEIGLRRLADAERTLDELAALGIDRTHVLVGEQRNLHAKLLLARGDARSLLEVDGHEIETSPSAAGEHAALLAIAAAAGGAVALARSAARRARRASRSIETRHYARLALLLARLNTPELGERVRREAVDLAVAAAGADVLDALVIGYRAQPRLLEVLAAEPSLVPMLRDLVAQANDHALGRRVGLAASGRPDARGIALLTPRENEVLELMAHGLGNGDIARRLFISEKTAKVHVYHIFEKLNVQTRVQAVLAAQEARAAGAA